MSLQIVVTWEIYMLIRKGRIELSMDADSWTRKLESASYIDFIPVDNRIAAKSAEMAGILPGDPADRIIVATANHLGAALVTSDKKIRKHPLVRTVW